MPSLKHQCKHSYPGLFWRQRWRWRRIQSPKKLLEILPRRVETFGMSSKLSSLHWAPLNFHLPKIYTHSDALKHLLWQVYQNENTASILLYVNSVREVQRSSLYDPVSETLFTEIYLPLYLTPQHRLKIGLIRHLMRNKWKWYTLFISVMIPHFWNSRIHNGTKLISLTLIH